MAPVILAELFHAAQARNKFRYYEATVGLDALDTTNILGNYHSTKRPGILERES